MAIEGVEEWGKKKEHLHDSPDFHLETKVDPVETLIQEVGWEDALSQINDNLGRKPNDQEARRQATLIVRLYDERVKSLKDKLQH